MTEQMASEELHRVLDTVRDGDVIEAKISRSTMVSPAIIELGKNVALEYIYLRTELGALAPGLTSVRVVERARPDWAADDVAMIRTSCNAVWSRPTPGHVWCVWGATKFLRTEYLIRELADAEVRVVARFEQAQP